MKKKLVLFALLILSCLCLLAGCNKYHPELYDNVGEWIREEFKNDNRTKGAYYDDELDSSSYPKNRTFIVNNQEEYDKIFIEGVEEFSVDFNNQTLIVYTFTTVYHRNNRITNLDMNDNVLKISYKMESKFGVGDASQPFQRWFVVKLDKVDITSVDFEEK